MSLETIRTRKERLDKAKSKHDINRLTASLEDAIKFDTEASKAFIKLMRNQASKLVGEANESRPSGNMRMYYPATANRMMTKVRFLFAQAAHCNIAANRMEKRANGKQLQLI